MMAYKFQLSSWEMAIIYGFTSVRMSRCMMALHSITTFHKPEVKLVAILGTTAQGTACTVVRSFKVAQNHRDINSSNM